MAEETRAHADRLLPKIGSPDDLRGMSLGQLQQVAEEIREALCQVAATRTAHFASNLGVVELTLALHTTFDFRKDRLVWDTGHQIYPHKLVTGRYEGFPSIRTRGGLMGYPNPAESEYDLFMTGHAGCSVSSIVGLRCGDELLRPDEDRKTVAVVGDGAFPCGTIFEAMNHVGGLRKNLIVILNDNKMSICPRVGGLGQTLDRMRMTSLYTNLKLDVQRLLHKIPLLGDPTERLLSSIKASLKAGLLGGMFFEDLGFRYIGPINGHNIQRLQKYLAMVRDAHGPTLLHVVTEKGHGFRPAVEDPRTFHAPDPFRHENGEVIPHPRGEIGAPPYTTIARDAIAAVMKADPRAAVITAAMCQGNKLEPIRDTFPDRFFDVGICESHAVAFAGGLAKSGMRPIVTIYSTFMQRSYDQIFQELALQKLPVLLMLDRAGLVGPDGQTHHGTLDLTYLRPLPNMTVMAPGDTDDLEAMVRFAMRHDGPTAIRYPKAPSKRIERNGGSCPPVQLGRAEALKLGNDLTLIACGTLVGTCLEIAAALEAEDGLQVGVINARFVKPLDTETILQAVRRSRRVVTVEEGQLMGGFGSAVLEAANAAGVATDHIHRLGIADRFIDHATRDEQLAEVGLDHAGILAACRAHSMRLADAPD